MKKVYIAITGLDHYHGTVFLETVTRVKLMINPPTLRGNHGHIRGHGSRMNSDKYDKAIDSRRRDVIWRPYGLCCKPSVKHCLS